MPPDEGGRNESRRRRRRAEARQEATGPRWAKDMGPKICRKCGGRMYPADWIWQKYGLCVGWRCSKCKEKVMARSLPFKGLRKRTLDPDEAAALGKARTEALGRHPVEESAGGGADEAAEEPRPRSEPPRRSPRRRR